MPVLVLIPVIAGFGAGAYVATAGFTLLGSTLLAATAAGAVAGAVVGGITSAITGGDIMEGVLYGAVGGAVGGFLGGVIGPSLFGPETLVPSSMPAGETSSLQVTLGADGFAQGSIGGTGGEVLATETVKDTSFLSGLTPGEKLIGAQMALGSLAGFGGEDGLSPEEQIMLAREQMKSNETIAAGRSGGGGGSGYDPLRVATLQDKFNRDKLAVDEAMFSEKLKLERQAMLKPYQEAERIRLASAKTATGVSMKRRRVNAALGLDPTESTDTQTPTYIDDVTEEVIG